MGEAFAFYLFAGVMVASALTILCARNIVRAATALLGALGAAAGLYLLLAAPFLAVVQLILYAGGVLILIVFGIMLTSRDSRLQPRVPAREVFAGVTTAAVLLAAMLSVLQRGVWPALPAPRATGEMASMRSIGEQLLTVYLLPFELVSMLLLVVLIGAAYLARPERTI